MHSPSFSEISAVKERLFDLQRLTQEAVAAADRGEPIPADLHERLNALAEEQMEGMQAAVAAEDDDDDYDDHQELEHEKEEAEGVMDALADSVAGLSSSVRCGGRLSVRR